MMTLEKVINAPTCLRADRPHRQMDGAQIKDFF